MNNSHIDIGPQEKISGPSNKAQVTKASWNPARGAEIARQQMEERMREEYRAQVASEVNDPVLSRVAKLESRMRLLENAVTDLVGSIHKDEIIKSAIAAEVQSAK